MSNLEQSIQSAADDGRILPESASNLRELLASSTREVDRRSIEELVAADAWGEIDDRFFKTLSFGTSGLRGRTIGRVVTRAEQGAAPSGARPEFPCVGTNAMNFYNLSRATQGLVRYIRRWASENRLETRPALVFAHDTRHFSREFAEFCAKIVTDLGCDAWLFESHRPTPELSFAIRLLGAQAGVMHTASHNPPHDNGYKVYFNEGDPIVDPVASGIIDEVNSVTSDAYEPVPDEDRGALRILGPEIDDAYLERLKDLLLQPALLEKAKTLEIVYTALHGTGGVHVPTILGRLGFRFATVPEQDVPDGRFPTVESPNPESAATLQMALDLAEARKADIVMGTDPDCDRLGVAVRDGSGTMRLLTGNQIGSLMAWYRTKTLFDQGILHEGNRDRAIIIKTFVTTALQRAIAVRFGVRILDTLTGFKYIGAKLTKYEHALPAAIRERYRTLSTAEARAAQLEHGTFFIFGGEESYGYLGTDFVRDKDGNGAVVMFAELAAHASSRGITVVDLLDEVYAEFGYFLERSQSVQFDGAAGAEQMRKLAESYSSRPPAEIDGSTVVSVRDFSQGTFRDEEGDPIPPEKMLIIDLDDGRSVAVRPSGTEPKMKFYFFGARRPAEGARFSTEELAAAKAAVADDLDTMWDWMSADMKTRLDA